MNLENLPTTEGQPVYALAEKVFTYREPDINTILGDDVKTAGNDGIFWASGTAIGTFTGEKTVVGNTIWYKLNSKIFVKPRSAFQWRDKYASYQKNGSYIPLPGSSWFMGPTITVKDKEAIKEENKAAADKAFDDALKLAAGKNANGEATTGTGETPNVGVFGSSVFGSSSNSQSIILIIASVATLGLIGYFLSLRKKKSKPQPPVFDVPANYIDNLKTTRKR